MTQAKTGRDVISARKALVAELEEIHTAPKDAPDKRPALPALTVFADLIGHGGVLSVTRDPENVADVLLNLHGVPVIGASFEEAIENWLIAAKASLSKESAGETNEEDMDP